MTSSPEPTSRSSVPATLSSKVTPVATFRHPIAQTGPCPITPPQSDFWNASGPVAGEYPVWISSRGQERYSHIGPIVLPPTSGEPQFEEGRATKALVFVDKSVPGNLTITGHQLDGNRLVYFPREEEITRLNATTLQLLGTPEDSYMIPDAHQTNKLPEPPGKAVQGVQPVYTKPGCYEFVLKIEEHAVRIVVEIVDS